MSIEQVSVEIMKRQFTFGTPTSEKETLLQAVEMLSHKIDAVREGGRVIENDKIVILAALNVVHDLLKMKACSSVFCASSLPPDIAFHIKKRQ